MARSRRSPSPVAFGVVDRIEFIVTPTDLPWRRGDRVEPVINGKSLVEIISRAEGEDEATYSGLRPEDLLPVLRERVGSTNRQLLACGCGDYKCSWVCAEVRFVPGEVIWKNFRSSRSRGTELASIGPYRFDGLEFAQTLFDPTRRDTPVRPPEWPAPV